MRKREIVLACILPFILTIVIGIYLNIAKTWAHGAVGLNYWTGGEVAVACPPPLDVLGNRAAPSDSKDFGTLRRGTSDVYVVAPSGASPNLLDA
jgi:hypothetical protein